MNYTINHLIYKIKQAEIVNSQPHSVSMLSAIEKFDTNNTLQAYLLGTFFKYQVNSNELPLQDKELLIDTIKHLKLEPYFYMKKKPADELNEVTYILAAGGPLAIAVGIIMLLNGNFTYGLGTKYLVPVIREGGFLVILGMGFLIAGLIRLKHDLEKKRLLKYLTKRNK